MYCTNYKFTATYANMAQRLLTVLKHEAIRPSFHGHSFFWCIVDCPCPSPEVTILCLRAQRMNVFMAPLVDAIQPFSIWSASYWCSFCYTTYDAFHPPGFFNLIDMTGPVQFSFCNDYNNVLCGSHCGYDFHFHYFCCLRLCKIRLAFHL